MEKRESLLNSPPISYRFISISACIPPIIVLIFLFIFFFVNIQFSSTLTFIFPLLAVLPLPLPSHITHAGQSNNDMQLVRFCFAWSSGCSPLLRTTSYSLCIPPIREHRYADFRAMGCGMGTPFLPVSRNLRMRPITSSTLSFLNLFIALSYHDRDINFCFLSNIADLLVCLLCHSEESHTLLFLRTSSMQLDSWLPLY